MVPSVFSQLIGTVFLIIFVSCQADQVCYGKYGCFNDKAPFNRPLIPLPQHPDEIGTTYYLTTRQDPSGHVTIDDHDVSRLQASSYDGSKNTVIIVHGWIEGPNDASWIDDLRNALIAKEDVNVIVAGWKAGAEEFYTIAVANTRVVGAQIAELIKFLNNNANNSPASFHVIGFSLGGQIAGYVGKRLQDVKLGRITGLDPAAPYYFDLHIDVRLDQTDADFVDVIHTNAPFVGTLTKSGHLDFWPNGGLLQRGCEPAKVGVIKSVICHHFRAPDFYVDSILSHCPFRSYRCSHWGQFTRGNCMSCGSSGCPEMGHNAIKYKGQVSGNFYLYTNEDQPFCVQRYVLVTFRTHDGWFADGYNPRIVLHGDKGSSGKIKLALRHLKAGSKESFVAPLKSDLGALKSIDVSHMNPLNLLDSWRLDKVTVEFVDTGERYTACFGSWTHILLAPVNRSLSKGDKSC